MSDQYLATFESRTPGSRKLYEEATRLTPGALSHDSRRTGPYPIYFTHGKGSKLWDVDGNEYIDLWMAHYDAILGHAPPVVVNKVKEAADSGLHLGVAMPYEVELAQRVVDVVPSAEEVRFCTSGTEATMYAVRLARGYTGRNVMLKMVGGWHGANSDLMVDVRAPEFVGPESKGLIPELANYTRAVELNDIEGTARAIREAGDDWAGVIIEPAMGSSGFTAAEVEYLQFLREETRKAGAVLIFDEVITGFRLALGGGQERTGITPDLTTLGKILGGGMAVGAITGRADIMAMSDGTRPGGKLDKVSIGGGTYSCNPLSMIAGITTVDILKSRQQEIYPAIEQANAKLCAGIRSAFDTVGLPVHVSEYGSLQEVHFLKEPGLPVRNMRDMVANTDKHLQHELLVRLKNHGVFLIHGGAVSIEHTDADIDSLIRIYEACAQEMAEGN